MDVGVTSCEYFSAVMVGIRIFSFSIHSIHVAVWEWSVGLPCLGYVCVWMSTSVCVYSAPKGIYIYVCVCVCARGDYILNIGEFMSVSLFKIFWHSFQFLKNFL